MSQVPFVTANGAAIPAIGFGTYRMPGHEVLNIVPKAIDIGFRHIDTAQFYDNETEVGQAIKQSSVARADIFLTTKVWVENFAPARFAASVEDSLRKLGTDYVDLLLLHWPRLEVPLADQIGALNAVRTSGMVRHIGVSNYSTDLMRQAVNVSQAPIVTNQIEYHPYLDQSPVIAEAQRLGMSLTSYFAMADGRIFKDDRLKDMAAKYNKSVAQIVLRWIVQQDNWIVLSKTVSEDRARDNVAIFDFTLSDADMATLHALAHTKGRIVNPKGLAPVWDGPD